MKGTIVSAWVDTCIDIYGKELTDEALSHNGIATNKIFTPSEDIPDKGAIGFIEYIGKKVNKSSDEMWRTIGRHNIETYSKIYPVFFRYKSLYSFLQAMYDIHVVVTKRVKGAKPPIVGIKPVDKHTAHMTYSSPRAMFSFFHGMLEGAANYFKEDIKVETLEQTKDFAKISITFPDEIYYKKNFILNKALSFGLVKNMEGKIALSSFLLVGIPSALLLKFTSANIAIIGTLILSVIIPFIISKGLFSPLKYINVYLDDIINRDFSMVNNISTNDFFEDINEKLESFISNINTLVEDISNQYNLLEDGNIKLNTITEDNMVSINSIEDVKDLIIELINELTQETKNMNSISGNISSLSAIAEENSASTEEASANIYVYSEEILNMTKNIEEFKKVSMQFSKDLEKYIL